jgi:uncharacterized protein (TIGR00251 family)
MRNNSNDRHGAMLSIRVVPRSSRSEIVGLIGNELKVKVNSPPVDGSANDELMRLLAKEFGVSRSNIEIVSGHTSKQKRIRITGLDDDDITAVLKAKS